MNMKKIVASASALALTAAVAVGGTLAFLQDNTEALTNNFTYNAASQNVALEIYEHKINPDNQLTVFDTPYAEDDTDHFVYEGGNQTYTIMPGATVAKDPTLRVTSGNTKVYLYAEVVPGGDTTAIQTINVNTTDWEELGVPGKNGGTVYVLKTCKDGGIATGLKDDQKTAETDEYKVLNSVTYASTLSNDANASIAVYGYVVDAVAGSDPATVYTATFNPGAAA